MSRQYRIQGGSMATPWRRRRMCVIHADAPSPAALESVSGRGATIRSNVNPECGAKVRLVHPAAGEIIANGPLSDPLEPGTDAFLIPQHDQCAVLPVEA